MQPAANQAPSALSPNQRPFRPLRKRFIGWQVFYCALTGLVIASAQLLFHFLDKRENSMQIMRSASVTHMPQLATQLAQNNLNAVRIQLEEMGRFPTVGYLILTLPNGEKIKAGRQADRWGQFLLDKFSSWPEVLVDPAQPRRVLGQLRIYASREDLRAEVAVGALLIFTCQMLGGLVLALMMARISNKLVGRHLAHIAEHISVLGPGALHQPLSLVRRQRPFFDEFDQLCEAFNRMNMRLASYIESHRLLEDELREHRDGLSALVAERTSSLERLKDFHSLIIAMLTRFMSLPPEQANAAVDSGLAAFCEYFDAPRCILFTLDDAGRGFRIANTWPPLPRADAPVEVWLASDTLEQESTGVRGAKIWLSTVAPADHETATGGTVLKLLDASACTIVGVEIMDRTVGLLCLVGQALPPGSDNAKLLELAARVAANMLDHKVAQTRLVQTQAALQSANQELHHLSLYDPLTGLANRRRFDEVKALEFSRALRAESPLAVMMCDIDHFKFYNDTYGHAQGDRCLKALADCLTTLAARAGELPARLGGEEFAVLLPGATAELALAQAERLRQAVWDLSLPHAGSLVADRVTISIGVACLRHDEHAEFDSLLHAADEALYCAKVKRNSVAMAS